MTFIARLTYKAILQMLGFVAIAVVLGVYVQEAEQPIGAQEPRFRADFQKITTASTKKAEQEFPYKLVTNIASKSYPGFTMIPVSGTAETILINHAGVPVHSWQQDAERARLLPDCKLVVLHGSKWGYRQEKWRNLKFAVREYGWNDSLEWEFVTDEWVHHDIFRRTNGNYVFLKRTTIPAPAVEGLSSLGESLGVRSDTILEVDRAKNIVWQWNVHDQFPLDQCGWRGCEYLRVRDIDADTTKFSGSQAEAMGIERITDWSHTNTVTELPDNKWHQAGDLRFAPGNLLIIIRNFWTAYIVSKESGKVVWEYNGNPTPGDEASGMIRGHDMYMIPEGLPGAGNLLAFDNGLDGVRPFSRILEIQPVTQEIVWEYSDPDLFYSDAAGSVQRLPNGNTLISEDKSGRVFEVTNQGEIVWDLRGPHRISRAERYTADYCPDLSTLPLR